MARRRQKWSVGDAFVVPRADGRFVVGQIVGREPELFNSVSVALFDRVLDSPDEMHHLLPPKVSEAFSVQFTTRDLLDSGRWAVVTQWPVRLAKEMLPYEHLRMKNFTGAKVIGSANIEKLVNSFYSLAPWDGFKDPNYLDDLLISPEKEPAKRLVYKKDQPQP